MGKKRNDLGKWAHLTKPPKWVPLCPALKQPRTGYQPKKSLWVCGVSFLRESLLGLISSENKAIVLGDPKMETNPPRIWDLCSTTALAACPSDRQRGTSAKKRGREMQAGTPSAAGLCLLKLPFCALKRGKPGEIKPELPSSSLAWPWNMVASGDLTHQLGGKERTHQHSPQANHWPATSSMDDPLTPTSQ